MAVPVIGVLIWQEQILKKSLDSLGFAKSTHNFMASGNTAKHRYLKDSVIHYGYWFSSHLQSSWYSAATGEGIPPPRRAVTGLQ